MKATDNDLNQRAMLWLMRNRQLLERNHGIFGHNEIAELRSIVLPESASSRPKEVRHIYVVTVSLRTQISPVLIDNYVSMALKKFDRAVRRLKEATYFDGLGETPSFRIDKINIDTKQDAIRQAVFLTKQISDFLVEIPEAIET